MRYIFGGKIYYIAIFPPIQVKGKMAMGEKWLYNTGIKSNLNFF